MMPSDPEKQPSITDIWKNNDDHDMTDPTGGSETIQSERHEDLLEEVVGDNLDLMYEVCMKIREDPDYAKSIYADCPRLQHLLDKHPDLRPVFEEQNLVRINFEQVYRKAGGDRLPEDKPSRFKRTIACIVTHPLFKVFRCLIVIKKLFGCITGGGASAIRSCFAGLCLGGADEVAHLAVEGADGAEGGDIDVDTGNIENQENLEALNRAADYMEANEEQMQKLLECQPDELDELIEQDPELRALRDSNPLCSELMHDQATLKILIDPDNLRALGECPDLIEADFADPTWSPPEVEPGQFDQPDVVEVEADADAGEEVEAEGGEDEEPEETDLLEDYEAGDRDDTKAGTSRSANKKGDKKDEKGSRVGNMAQQGMTGLFDTVIGNAVGIGLEDLTFGGGDDGLEALVDEAGDAADGADSTLDRAAEVVTSDEVGNKVDRVEDTLDVVEDKHERFTSKAAAASAAESGVLVAGGTGRAADVDDEEEGGGEKKKKKVGLGGAIGAAFSSAATATKEFAVSAVLGEDLAEDLVEKMEESSDDESDEDDKGKEEKTRRWGKRSKK